MIGIHDEIARPEHVLADGAIETPELPERRVDLRMDVRVQTLRLVPQCGNQKSPSDDADRQEESKPYGSVYARHHHGG